MKDYILLLPIIFIFHDMEEIVGFEWFFRKNPYLYDRFPKILKYYKDLSTEVFAMGVYEAFIPFFGVSLLTYYFPSTILYALWYGIFLSLAGHFIVHIGQVLYIKKYIPCVITSIICLPVSIMILKICASYMVFNIHTIGFIILGIIGMIANFIIAHLLMDALGERIK